MSKKSESLAAEVVDLKSIRVECGLGLALGANKAFDIAREAKEAADIAIARGSKIETVEIYNSLCSDAELEFERFVQMAGHIIGSRTEIRCEELHY